MFVVVGRRISLLGRETDDDVSSPEKVLAAAYRQRARWRWKFGANGCAATTHELHRQQTKIPTEEEVHERIASRWASAIPAPFRRSKCITW